MRAWPDPRLPLDDVIAGARLLRGLPSFLRHPIRAVEARSILRRRLERRESDFLALVRRVVYANRCSPYRDLLRVAGCEYGDLERLVGHDGLEGALLVLYRRGVYLTVGEVKGRHPVVRGSATIAVGPAQLRNPLAATHVPIRSSGSRGEATAVPINLRFLRDRAVDACLARQARGGADWVGALWGVPGGSAIALMLVFSGAGARPARWFSQVEAGDPGLHPRYRWGARLVRWGSLASGVPLPRPEHVPLNAPSPIVRWMAGMLRAGRTPHLWTFSSSAVRVCQAALEAGVDLRGVQITAGGEPITEARLATIHRSGAEAVPSYGSAECGDVGYACLAPTAPDDVHLPHDLHAMIQPGADPESTALPAGALLISSLRPSAPLIMLNVSMGDQAVLRRRACGCPLESIGWTWHLHAIRSYEKLTSGGAAFLSGDVIRVLEEVLPARFGGSPTDYQLLEEEAGDGSPRLRLLVHPALGPLDHEALVRTFLEALGRGAGAERVMGLAWRSANSLRVERQVPRATDSGKIPHLYVNWVVPTSSPTSA